ncbi:MAG: hypothetical protein HOI95_25435 [Chromatiales bacterium]|jgi:phosphosulfolactate synthase|nr:hypothetical protein [Chromatiales bacterium]
MPTPFASVPLPARSAKPRQRGLTMMMDWGLPLNIQKDWVEMLHPYVDLVKLVVGTARLYDEAYLLEKLAAYRKRDIRPFLGGQFLEYVFHAQGMAGVAPFCREALRLGIAAIEVSDNVVTLSDEQRRTLILTAADCGLEVHGEVGSKETLSDAPVLIKQAQDCLAAGADVVLVEAAELVRNGQPDEGLIGALRDNLDLDKVIFELGGPWIKDTTQSANYQLKVFLIRTFGPDVNLANVMPDVVWETEASRLGLGVAGPLPQAFMPGAS